MSDLTKLSNDTLSLTVSPRGAEMTRFQAGGVDLLWHGDETWWGSHAPVLFPIVGNSVQGHIAFEGKDYPLHRHGFARKTGFSLLEASATKAVFQLTDSEKTRAQYPYAFAMNVIYELDGGTLTNTIEIENRDTRPMPFGVGFHPAFLCPFPGSEKQTHYIQLTNKAEPLMARLTEGNEFVQTKRYPSPFAKGRFDIDRSYFDEDAMIFPEGAGDGLILGADGGSQLSFTFSNLPNLAIWAKPGPCPYICIEPWSGMCATEGTSNDIYDRVGTQVLDSGENKRFSYSVTPDLT